MLQVYRTLAASVLVAFFAVGCATAPSTEEKKEQLGDKVQATINHFKSQDSELKRWFDTAEGYAVFPAVGKGAVGVGGAYGRGQLFEKGNLAGFCSLTQASIGFQLGGQAYSEIIFFENKSALDRFKEGNLAFAAQATAVALKSGVGANARYANGVAVFTNSEQGLMYEASIGGQKFKYEPK